MAIEFLKQCEKELLDCPEEVREDLADALARLERGHTLSMPLSRPMPSIGSGSRATLEGSIWHLPSNLLLGRR